MLVEQVFLSYDAKEILKIPICTRNMDDFWAWNFETNGVFLILAYRIDTKRRREDWLEGRQSLSNNEQTQKIMGQIMEGRGAGGVEGVCRVFLWRLAKHSLPTEDVHSHRHMSRTCTCSICGMDDSWQHSLIECSMARCVWALVDEELLEHMIATTEPNAMNWLFSMIEVLLDDAFVRMTVTLWAVWMARHKLIHDGINQSSLSTHLFCFMIYCRP